ncbi:terpene cyclase [Neopestalotiopsis sp. 37M]|nr:terpene cyclase [Neopestalotiopsis sp. 37M]
MSEKLIDTESLRDSVANTVQLAADYAHHAMKLDGHWLTELRATVGFTAGYICLRKMMGPPLSEIEAEKMSRWILAQQNASDGSWGLLPDRPGDVSTTTEGYFALKLLGVPAESHPMQRARSFILSQGGISKVGVFTQLELALMGILDWNEMAQVPAELILLPASAPVSIYAFSYWSRVTAVPIMILRHHRPVHRIVAEDFLDELFVDSSDKHLHFTPSLSTLWQDGETGRLCGSLADKALGVLEPILRRVPMSRKYALSCCVRYILDHLDAGGYGAFWNSNFAAIMALHAEGFSTQHPAIQHLLKAIDTCLWEDDFGIRMQVTIGPVWDTALMALGLLESGQADSRMDLTVQWFKSRQILDIQGDYRVRNYKLAPGGWAFQYCNSYYPDTDDTLVAIMAIIMHNPSEVTSQSCIRAIDWLLGMQCYDGGWACFDMNNDHRYLNLFPFGQGNQFYDPSVPDITGRILECLGLVRSILTSSATKAYSPLLDPLLGQRIQQSCRRGILFLESAQEPVTGVWGSRWHVNYLNGTSSVLCGLMSVRNIFQHDQEILEAINSMIVRPLSWLKSTQNADGGWGEDVCSYSDESMAGRGVSTPTQTAWGIMGLLAFVPPTDSAVTRAVEYLVQTQTGSPVSEEVGVGIGAGPGATWTQKEYVSVGFPDILWLDYASSRHGYPMIALGRWLHEMKRLS